MNLTAGAIVDDRHHKSQFGRASIVCAIQSSLLSIVGSLLGACGLLATTSSVLAATFPQYDHVFLLIEENEGFEQIIGNQFAPILNALATDYGLATNYRGVADPSEPNYVAMLGGDFFGISSDDPYWFPGNTINAENLMSQLEGAGKTWKGYFQGMPYPGYRGYVIRTSATAFPMLTPNMFRSTTASSTSRTCKRRPSSGTWSRSRNWRQTSRPVPFLA
jgi:phospholipase C